MPATDAHDVDMTADIAYTVEPTVTTETTDTVDTVSTTLNTLNPPEPAPEPAPAHDPVAVADAIKAPPSPTTGRKEPPPEKPSDVRRRSLIILAFWLIVLCLGLPIWWHTTTIPRASLPLDQMMDWADGKVRRRHYQSTKVPLYLGLPTAPPPPPSLWKHARSLQLRTFVLTSFLCRPADQSSLCAFPSRRTSSRNKRPRTCCA